MGGPSDGQMMQERLVRREEGISIQKLDKQNIKCVGEQMGNFMLAGASGHRAAPAGGGASRIITRII